MVKLYIDTSAALKLVITESGSMELRHYLAREGSDPIASMLLLTELHCAAQRRSFMDLDVVKWVLDTIVLVDVMREDLLRAATSNWRLRSGDAIHLATAIRIGATHMLTYDKELADAAARVSCK